MPLVVVVVVGEIIYTILLLTGWHYKQNRRYLLYILYMAAFSRSVSSSDIYTSSITLYNLPMQKFKGSAVVLLLFLYSMLSFHTIYIVLVVGDIHIICICCIYVSQQEWIQRWYTPVVVYNCSIITVTITYIILQEAQHCSCCCFIYSIIVCLLAVVIEI